MRQLLFLLLIVVQSSTAHAAADAQLNRQVSALVSMFSDGIATDIPEQKRIMYGNLFGTSRKDAVVIFSLGGFDGGNGFEEYLAFFQGNEPYEVAGRKALRFRLAAVLHVGGSGWQTLDWKTARIVSGRFEIGGFAWVDGRDAECCPSKPISLRFAPVGRSVAERTQ